MFLHGSLCGEALLRRSLLPRGGLVVLAEQLVLVALPHRVRLATDEGVMLPAHASLLELVFLLFSKNIV